MPWPTKAAVERAASVIHRHKAKQAKAIAELALDAAGLPDMVGHAEACTILDVKSGNLDRVANLPAPVQDLQNGRLWLREDIEALAAARLERKR